MKTFDLEKAKAGAKVCTRDGKEARIICFDMAGDYPIVALVKLGTNEEHIVAYLSDGRISDDRQQGGDLMLADRLDWVKQMVKEALKDAHASFTVGACDTDLVGTYTENYAVIEMRWRTPISFESKHK